MKTPRDSDKDPDSDSEAPALIVKKRSPRKRRSPQKKERGNMPKKKNATPILIDSDSEDSDDFSDQGNDDKKSYGKKENIAGKVTKSVPKKTKSVNKEKVVKTKVIDVSDSDDDLHDLGKNVIDTDSSDGEDFSREIEYMEANRANQSEDDSDDDSDNSSEDEDSEDETDDEIANDDNKKKNDNNDNNDNNNDNNDNNDNNNDNNDNNDRNTTVAIKRRKRNNNREQTLEEEAGVELPKVEEVDPIDYIVIRNIYKKLTKDEMVNRFENVYNKWITEGKDRRVNILMVHQLAFRNFEIDPNRLTFSDGMDIIARGKYKALYEIDTLECAFQREPGLLAEIAPESKLTYSQRFAKVREVVYYTEQMLRSALRAEVAQENTYDSTLNDDIGFHRFSAPDPNSYDKLLPGQKLQIYILSELNQKGYRRYQGKCYRPILNKAGHFTYAWQEVCDIETFIYNRCQLSLNSEQWENMTNGSTTLKTVVNHLEKAIDTQFLELKKNRHVYSFTNGIYICKNYDKATRKYKDSFHVYGEKPAPPSTLTACKYFNQEFNNFNEYEDWFDIPTPYFQSILKYQFETHPDYLEISRWMYIFIGRLIYDVGELDNWQVIPFIKGLAGSGKGTIVTNIARELYDICDVGVVGNESEGVFGPSAFYDKNIFIAPEIKKDFTLPQALFQSMISGEAVSVPVKHKVAVNVPNWKPPGIMAGNEPPGYKDNAGSLGRRMILFSFRKKVNKKDSDPKLPGKLKLEMPSIIKKCNTAYLEAVDRYGMKDVWPQLPEYFKETKASFAEQTNPLQHFLSSGKLRFSNQNYCSFSDFRTAYNIHCAENNLGKHTLSADDYESPFAETSERIGIRIYVQKKTRKRWEGKMKHGTFIMGLRLVEDDEEEEEDENPEQQAVGGEANPRIVEIAI